MVDISNNSVFSETDASNNSVTLPGFPENMNPSLVDDAARSLQGAVKRSWNRSNATVTSGGSGNAQTLSYAVAPVSLGTGEVYTFIAGFTNSGSTTLNVNALGAVTLKYQGANLVGGEIVAGQIVSVAYDGTNFQLIARSGGVLSPGFTTGSVVFQGASGLAQDNANFFYDGTNHNLGLGGAVASTWRLAVIGHGTTSATYALVVENSTGSGLLYCRDDGLVQFPAYGNGALSVSGGALVAGTLAVVNGGTGVTTSTGTGSVVLSNAPTFTGTIAATGWNITQAGAATFAVKVDTTTYQVGGVALAAANLSNGTTGNGAVVLATTPTISGTLNLTAAANAQVTYFLEDAGLGVAAVYKPAASHNLVLWVNGHGDSVTVDNATGNTTFSGTAAGSGWNITTAGAATFNASVTTGVVNISGTYEVNGSQIAASNLSNGTSGSGAILLASANSPAASGYTWIGNILFQWGSSANFGGGTTASITYPIAFPTSVFIITATIGGTSGLAVSVGNVTTTTATANASGGNTTTASWFAVGH